ncbi:hypothetical protein SAMN05216349_11757 [Oribacterium sp. KHPX15]|uniref:Wadjet anti-phage system protein JetD domain-containing protein n=1 Tax=Oribacterium sp. KHPX15 TaxID=1855342 RepID=UPI00089D7DDE|nr:Wadjet anti-phage system protein JetD domain-containing protein [Oribacterium sp. KHPX15]SEA57474.1 hypothetical protein SAMN05216349_11757 [Oribacterium sp. KHPX15]
MQKKEITKYQRKVLSLLLNKYERSKTYSGENKVNQSFVIRPDAVFREYYSDFADPRELRNFHQEMEELEHFLPAGVGKPEDFSKADGNKPEDVLSANVEKPRQFSSSNGVELVTLSWKNGEIQSIKANVEVMPFYYKLLGSESKDQLREAEKEFYRGWLGAHPIIDIFVTEQLERLESGKKASLDGHSSIDRETADKVLKLVEALITNEKDILERELSIMVLSDSKTFEKQFRTRVCRFLTRYDKRWENETWDEIEDEREKQQIILEEYQVFANPSYVYLKGDGDLWFEGSGEKMHLSCEHPQGLSETPRFDGSGEKLHLSCKHPLALSSETLRKLKRIKIYGEKIITVENLTSFNRLPARNDSFYIYLSGYHNTVKQKLLQKIYKDQEDERYKNSQKINNDQEAEKQLHKKYAERETEKQPQKIYQDHECEKQWLHFGDIDPDGFYILESLRRGTGIDISPLWMGIDELKTYADYGKHLEENDRTKAKNLLSYGKYTDVISYMLENNLKLEQEIISWMSQFQPVPHIS